MIFILFLLLFNRSTNYIDCEDIKNPNNKNDCRGKLSVSEIKQNFKYCCFIKFDIHKLCISFNQEDYDDIKPHPMKLFNNKYKIEC